jgi:hypothetical protein
MAKMGKKGGGGGRGANSASYSRVVVVCIPTSQYAYSIMHTRSIHRPAKYA